MAAAGAAAVECAAVVAISWKRQGVVAGVARVRVAAAAAATMAVGPLRQPSSNSHSRGILSFSF